MQYNAPRLLGKCAHCDHFLVSKYCLDMSALGYYEHNSLGLEAKIQATYLGDPLFSDRDGSMNLIIEGII